jgi:hypothetical protein
MKFGSWTYSGEQVDLVHINQTNGSTPFYGNNSKNSISILFFLIKSYPVFF